MAEADLEYAPRQHIEAHQLARLRNLVGFLQNKSHNQFYQHKLAQIQPEQVQSYADLAHLPFTYKSELVAEQQNYPPYGRNLSYPYDTYVKLHQTSGTTGRPMKVYDTAESWDWVAGCWVRIYTGMGVLPSDRIFFAFSFGMFLGFWAAFDGAKKLGAFVLPGGGMDTEQRLAAILENDITVVCCTPSYALHLAEVAQQQGIDLKSSRVRILVLAGEPGASIPAVRQRIEAAWGAQCHDNAGATEIGCHTYSCANQTGLHFIEDEFIMEVIDPVTTLPVPDGTPGELVVTNLGRWSNPVIRYRTNDIVKVAPNGCACGRSFKLLESGIIGRVDNMVVVRGVNIYPSSVEAIIREIPEAQEFRLIFFREQEMDQLEIEVELPATDSVNIAQLNALLRQRLGLRVPIKVVPPGSLPRYQLKAKRIVDHRPKPS